MALARPARRVVAETRAVGGEEKAIADDVLERDLQNAAERLYQLRLSPLPGLLPENLR